MDIAGALVTADAAHTCIQTARYLRISRGTTWAAGTYAGIGLP